MNNGDEEEGDDEDSFEESIELKFMIDLLKSPIVKIDEFSLFSQNVKQLGRIRQDTP